MPNASSRDFRRWSKAGAALLACAAGASVSFAPRDAHAIVDFGIEAMAQQRQLAGDNYKPGIGVQGNIDLTIIPAILKFGLYGSWIAAKRDVSNIDTNATNFVTGGLRIKGVLPLPGVFHPYALVGVGFTHADMPDATVNVCTAASPLPPSQIPPAVLASLPPNCIRKVPNLNGNFGEVTLGVGFQLDITGPLQLIVEADAKPTFGYSNDQYEQQIHGSVNGGTTTSSGPPVPSRNGIAWTGLVGLGLSY